LGEGLIVRGDNPSGELMTDRGKLWRLTRPLNGIGGERLARENGTLARENRSH